MLQQPREPNARVSTSPRLLAAGRVENRVASGRCGEQEPVAVDVGSDVAATGAAGCDGSSMAATCCPTTPTAVATGGLVPGR